MYKTGDFVRYQPDGSLVFIGRQDGQIQLRGFRIELGEIEHVLQKHPAIGQCAVIPMPNAAAPELLHAFLAPLAGSDVDSEAIRRFMRDRLPEHMVPGELSILDSVPLNSNGKIDRKVLLSEAMGVPRIRKGIVRPRNPVEVQVVRIWHDLLGQTDIGVTENFFDVGGHSMMAARMMSEIETIFGRKLALHILWYGEGTVEDLARRLCENESGDLWSHPIPIKAGGNRTPPVLRTCARRHPARHAQYRGLRLESEDQGALLHRQQPRLAVGGSAARRAEPGDQAGQTAFRLPVLTSGRSRRSQIRLGL